jgi:hypothetical protein
MRKRFKIQVLYYKTVNVRLNARAFNSCLCSTSSCRTAQNLWAVLEPLVTHLLACPLSNLYMAGPKNSRNLCIICRKKDMYKTQTCHPDKYCCSAHTHLLEALLEVLCWDGCEIWCHFSLNLFYWGKTMTFYPSLRVLGRARSCTDWDLENMFAGERWNFVLQQNCSTVWEV